MYICVLTFNSKQSQTLFSINSLPNNEILDQSKLKPFADEKNNYDCKIEIHVGNVTDDHSFKHGCFPI